jgi:Protein of unknown function (DUF1552)
VTAGRIDRRALLRGFGGALIALPALEACSRSPRDAEPLARAEQRIVGAPAKRFIAIMCPDGVEPKWWFPTGAERDFTLARHNQVLAPIQQHLLLTHGIDNQVGLDQKASGKGNGHAEGVSSLLTGLAPVERPVGSNDWYNAGPSIDQLIMQAHKDAGYVGATDSLHFGEEGPGGYSSISIRADGSRSDFYNAFGAGALDLLFAAGSEQSQSALTNARLRKHSILDGVKSDYQALAARVSGDDLRRVQAHLDALRSIEQRIDRVLVCQRPQLKPPMDDDQTRDLYYDVLVAALACDATRVATVSFRHSGGGGPKLPFADVQEDIHELSHSLVGEPLEGPAHAEFDRYHQWFWKKALSLVTKLKGVATPEGGTLFDDVVIFTGSEISIDHGNANMPFMLVAGDKTPIDTGRFVELPAGTNHTRLLVSLLHAFGVAKDQVGDAKYASGNLDSALFKA